MTDKKIIKALEICTEGIYICDKDCPYYDVKSDTRTSYCKFELLGDALDLINRQQAESNSLQEAIENRKEADRISLDAYEQLLYEVDYQQREIERLKKYNTDVAYKHYDDGIKEFAEKLKRELDMISYETAFEYQDTIETIDDLVKEMVGADNG